MNYTIRLASPVEWEAVRACVRTAYAGYIGRIGREPAPMLADYRALSAQGVVYVLADEATIYGVLVMMVQQQSLFIENVAVEPRYQGQGLGYALMAFAEQRAREERLSEIQLYTNELMVENLRFYQRLGFEEEGRGVQAGYRRVFLRKSL